MTQLGLRIGAMVEAVKHDPPHHGVLSTGEKLAVALVLNDFELLSGYKLANDGRDTRALQAYLGHKNIMHMVRYTEMSAGRFTSWWED